MKYKLNPSDSDIRFIQKVAEDFEVELSREEAIKSYKAILINIGLPYGGDISGGSFYEAVKEYFV